MDLDLEVRHHEAAKPAATLNKVGDALPGLGIVAAVLGVVITMGAIDGPAAEIGHKVGAALVGTFLGILMSYGFVQPLATSLEQRVAEEGHYEQCIKAGVLAVYKGFAPMVAVEFARRVLPDEVRPIVRRDREALQGRAARKRRRRHEHDQPQPIIVVKKKGGHGGHHGGAWKVAYADFVTAMMAFFLVMWLVGQSKPVKAGVGGYFRDPGVFDASGGRGVLPGADSVEEPKPQTAPDESRDRTPAARSGGAAHQGRTRRESGVRAACAIRSNSP